jgi:hypothetical protein
MPVRGKINLFSFTLASLKSSELLHKLFTFLLLPVPSQLVSTISRNVNAM